MPNVQLKCTRGPSTSVLSTQNKHSNSKQNQILDKVDQKQVLRCLRKFHTLRRTPYGRFCLGLYGSSHSGINYYVLKPIVLLIHFDLYLCSTLIHTFDQLQVLGRIHFLLQNDSKVDQNQVFVTIQETLNRSKRTSGRFMEFSGVTEIGHFYDNLSDLIHHNNLYKHT